MKKIIALLVTILTVSAGQVIANADWRTEYAWAVSGVEYCMKNNILTGDNGDLMLGNKLTRSQAAKIAAVAFGIEDTGSNSFIDTDPSCWDYPYINGIEKYIPKKSNYYRGADNITREEFAALIGSILGYSPEYDNSLHEVFSDAAKIDYDYRGYIAKAVESGIITGSNGSFRPKSDLTRAEGCVIIRRAIGTIKPIADESSSSSTQFTGSTNILGPAQITVEQAQKWAKANGASQKFIDIAPTYWYYGELTGIRPEVMYAQAALETAYGRYTGVVSEDMNNWAGIKVKDRNDDAKEAHETFATPEDGARAHFNHMCAYVGLEPIGTPHGRYYSVKSISWAGTVRTLEELSGKWCPDPNYANKILKSCLEPMSKY